MREKTKVGSGALVYLTSGRGCSHEATRPDPGWAAGDERDSVTSNASRNADASRAERRWDMGHLKAMRWMEDRSVGVSPKATPTFTFSPFLPNESSANK